MTSNAPSSDADAWQAGIEQFNQGDYYACHDTLEAIWMTAEIPEKPFFQGVLQLAVGLYHLGNHNWHGTAILLGEGIRRLEPFEPSYREIDVTDLLDCASVWLELTQQLGADQIALVAEALILTHQGKSGVGATATLPKWEIQPGK